MELTCINHHIEIRENGAFINPNIQCVLFCMILFIIYGFQGNENN